MAKKVVEHEIVAKQLSKVGMSKEMVDWLVAHGKKMDERIAYHDPLFVQCVKELNPAGFGIMTIKSNKYKVIDLLNDSLVLVPDDLKVLNNNWTIIEDEPKEESVVPEPEKPVKKPRKKANK